MKEYNSLMGLVLFTGIMFNSCSPANSEPESPEEGIKSPDVPRINFVVMSDVQSHENDSDVIWFDDFNKGEKDYMESTGDIDPDESFVVCAEVTIQLVIVSIETVR